MPSNAGLRPTVTETRRKAFDHRLDAVRATRLERFDTEPKHAPELLYHYTRMSTLIAILEGKKLWATEGHFLNDTTELRYAAMLAAEHIYGWRKHASWIEDVAGALERDTRDRPYLVFVASLSRACDRLSQWRAYADDGAGVALGFDLRTLTRRPIERLIPRPALWKCIYGIRAQRQAIAQCVDPQIEIAIAEKNLELENVVIETTRSLLVTIGLLGTFLKNPGFREEREWRILALAGGARVPSAVRFRDTEFGPAPFVEIPLARKRRLPLREVVLGPRADVAAERSIRLMLDRHQCDATITRSKVSYRSNRR